MKKLNGPELKALFVLSIVVPVGLLTTLRLTNILAEPPPLETITMEAVEWAHERPSMDTDIKEVVENSYRDENVSVLFKIFIDDYHTDWEVYGGSDLIAINVTATANASDGFVESIHVVFREDFNASEVWIFGHPDDIRYFFQMKNLSVEDWAGAGFPEKKSKLENNTKGFVTFVGVNKPSNVYFNFPTHWVLRSASNQSHEMTVALELVYHTKYSYVKVVLPIYLKLFA